MAERKNLRTRAYEEIKKNILLGEFKQGERIFVGDLSKRLSISQTPVREALLLLTNEKLVNSDIRSGFTVSRTSPSEIEEYFFFRELLESVSAPLIVQNISETDISALEKIIEKAQQAYAAKELAKYTELHMQFHTLMWESTKSKLYVDLIAQLNPIFILIIAVGARTEPAVINAMQGHREMLQCIRAKDVQALGKLLIEHIRAAKKYILPIYPIL